MDTIVLAGVIIAGFVIVFAVWRRQRRKAFEANVLQRINTLKQRAESPPKLHQPEDDDLDPALDYMNVSQTRDETRWNLVIFNTDGIVEKRLDVDSKFLETFVVEGQWQRIADRFQSSGYTMFHQRQRRS